jgi:hypothetical protein
MKQLLKSVLGTTTKKCSFEKDSEASKTTEPENGIIEKRSNQDWRVRNGL